MKKAFVVALLVCCTVSFAACGKSEKDEAVDFLQNEVGMSKEEADEFVEAFEDEGTETEVEVTEEETVQIELVSPSQEIINSKIGEPIVQVYNSVIKFDGTMTLDECVEKLEKENDLELNCDKSFGNPDEFVGSNQNSGFSLYDQDGNMICSLSGHNGTSEEKRLGDCTLTYVASPIADSPAALNFFYSGNICKGTYATREDITGTEAYAERIIDYPVLKNDEIKGFFESQGYALADDESYVDNKSGNMVYTKYIFSPAPVCVNDNGYEYYAQYMITVVASSEAISYDQVEYQLMESSIMDIYLDEISNN